MGNEHTKKEEIDRDGERERKDRTGLALLSLPLLLSVSVAVAVVAAAVADHCTKRVRGHFSHDGAHVGKNFRKTLKNLFCWTLWLTDHSSANGQISADFPIVGNCISFCCCHFLWATWGIR